MNSIYLILMIIIGATGIALIGSIFFCWIPSAHFRKVYHVGVILCEFLFLNFFIAGSILSRIHSGLSMGMLSGALFGICMSIFINLNENGGGSDQLQIILTIITAVLVCGLSVLRLRISTALNIFMGSFVILFLLFCMFLQGRVQSGIMLIITLILAMGLAVLGYLQHSYGFMIVTAVLGGFIAMIGVSSISADSNPGYIILTLMTEASETEKILLLAGSVLLAVCGIVVQVQSDTWRNPEAETKQIYTLISYINTFLDNDNVSLIASVLSLIAIPYCGYMLKNNMGYMLTGIASAVSVFILIQWTRKREYLKIMLFQVFYMAGYLLVEYAVYNGVYIKGQYLAAFLYIWKYMAAWAVLYLEYEILGIRNRLSMVLIAGFFSRYLVRMIVTGKPEIMMFTGDIIFWFVSFVLYVIVWWNEDEISTN